MRLWSFKEFQHIVGREILTLGEGFNTQVITLWCFNIVGREILTVGYIFIFVDPIASAYPTVQLYVLDGVKRNQARTISLSLPILQPAIPVVQRRNLSLALQHFGFGILANSQQPSGADKADGDGLEQRLNASRVSIVERCARRVQ
jgi:hypothetical protein